MIYLLRHGLDDENHVGGWSDLDLIPKGIEQVNDTLSKMKENNVEIKKIVSSDIKRAITTANMVKDSYGLNDIEISDKFREQDKGIMNGMLKTKADELYPNFIDSADIDTIYPDGESLKNLYDRINNILDYILSLDDDTLIVTHRGVINMLYYILTNTPLDMDKKQFRVTHASLHELDKKTLSIRKVI